MKRCEEYAKDCGMLLRLVRSENVQSVISGVASCGAHYRPSSSLYPRLSVSWYRSMV